MALTERQLIADTARETVEELRRTRARRMVRPVGDRTQRIWIALITAALLVCMVAGPVGTLSKAAGAVLAHAQHGRLPGLLVGLTTLATAGLLRLSLWLGPIVLPAPELSWLLPLPVDRRWLLRPRLSAALLAAGTAGAVLGAACGAMAASGGRPSPVGIGLAMAVGLLLAWLTAAIGVLAEGSARWARLVRAGSTLLGLAGLADLLAGHRPVLSDVLAASGPWGWAGRAIGGTAGGSAPVPLLAALALAGVTALAVTAADRSLATLPTGDLALRSRAAGRAHIGLLLLDFRQIALVAQAAARARRTGPGLRLPMPRSRLLILPWRDATALLRRPGRLVAAAAWSAGTVALLHATRLWAAQTHPDPLTAAWLGSLLSLGPYLAAAALVEPAREETDRPARTALLPFTPARIALSHLVVPTALMALLGAAAATATALLIGAPPVVLLAVLLLLTAGAPAGIGAALLGAYRGPLRYELMAVSADPYGAVPFVLWYCAPALVTVAVAAPLLWHAATATTLTAGTALAQFAVSAALAIALTVWRVISSVSRQTAP
ncbi:hypothetical protein E6W39_19640 [Kitasatospora acidiphila]|uniref:Uncharacterized protein n=1 Tax=Kitasatospora acidiphila TaxID=2567942 RepID=A0A540W529_9ACTN|nr:DUF6297 family protein [Kitasatospora acidiphila]TQF04037.1 hypothetical protein E6W39_19640 [Kitasatospora acidiphila]